MLHPHLATVTYLTEGGGPTIVLERASPLMADESACGPVRKAEAAFPQVGRHICFDGRMLHGAPSDIARPGGPRSKRRVTFLVNVWLNHVPWGSEQIDRVGAAAERTTSPPFDLPPALRSLAPWPSAASPPGPQPAMPSERLCVPQELEKKLRAAAAKQAPAFLSPAERRNFRPAAAPVDASGCTTRKWSFGEKNARMEVVVPWPSSWPASAPEGGEGESGQPSFVAVAFDDSAELREAAKSQAGGKAKGKAKSGTAGSNKRKR